MLIGFVQGYEELKWGISKLNPLCNGPLRGVPTMRPFLAIAIDVVVDTHQKKSLHSGNIYPVRFKATFDVKKLLKLLAMAFNQYLASQMFLLQWAHFPIITMFSGYTYFL